MVFTMRVKVRFNRLCKGLPCILSQLQDSRQNGENDTKLIAATPNQVSYNGTKYSTEDALYVSILLFGFLHKDED